MHNYNHERIMAPGKESSISCSDTTGMKKEAVSPMLCPGGESSMMRKIMNLEEPVNYDSDDMDMSMM